MKTSSTDVLTPIFGGPHVPVTYVTPKDLSQIDLRLGIVLVPGFRSTRTSSTYTELAAKITSELGFPVASFDHPGHGDDRGGDVDQFTLSSGMGRLLDVCTSFRTLLRVNQVVIYGKSMGGYLASLAPRYLDDMVAGLVLDAPAMYSKEWWAEPLSSFTQEEFISFRNSGAVSEHSGIADMCGFEEPLLVIEHGADTSVPARQVVQLFAASPSKRKRYVRIDDMPHSGGTEQQRVELQASVIDFLRGI